MSTSENINELAAALAKAQGSMANAALNKVNPHFKSKYADLASVFDAVRKPLSDNGLAVVQTVDGGLLVTRLLHTSGQWIESAYPLPVTTRPQEMGSALTYARRYSLSAIVGVAADEDDDANAAEGAKQRTPPKPAPNVLLHDPAPNYPSPKNTGVSREQIDAELNPAAQQFSGLANYNPSAQQVNSWPHNNPATPRPEAALPSGDKVQPEPAVKLTPPGDGGLSLTLEGVAREAAMRGNAFFYASFWDKRTPSERKQLLKIKDELKQIMEEADANAEGK